MGKYIVFTDTHFHLWQEFAQPDTEYVNTRFKEQIETLEKVFQTARDEKATLLFGGDLFHKRGAVDVRVMEKVFDVFAEYKDVKIVAISGNHDKVANKLESTSSLSFLKLLGDHVTVVSDKVDVVELDDVQVICVPYGDEVEEMKQKIKTLVDNLNPDKPSILLGHIGVDGAVTGKGNHRLEGAFSYHDLYPDKVDGIYLGHYHKPQTLGNNINHQYIGSLMQYSFNEEGNDTRVLEVDVEGSKLTTSEIHIPSTEFVTVDNSTDISKLPEDFFDTTYIRFKGTREQAQQLEKHAERDGEDLSHVRVVVEEDFNTETRIDIDNSTDPVNITKKYMQEYHPEAEELAVECIQEAIQ